MFAMIPSDVPAQAAAENRAMWQTPCSSRASQSADAAEGLPDHAHLVEAARVVLRRAESGPRVVAKHASVHFEDRFDHRDAAVLVLDEKTFDPRCRAAGDRRAVRCFSGGASRSAQISDLGVGEVDLE